MQTTVQNEPSAARAGLVEYPQSGFRTTAVCSTSITRADAGGRAFVHDVTAGKPWNAVKSPVASANLTTLIARGVAALRELEDGAEDAQNRTLSILKKGFIWVPTEELLVVNTNPFVRFVATGAEILGSWRTDADGSDAAAATWAKVIRVESASLALLQIDL